MGLRKKGASNIGVFPELLNAEYLCQCKSYIEMLIKEMKPSLIITLGKIPCQFVAKNFDNLNQKVENMPHPSMWHFNLKEPWSRERVRDIISQNGV